MKKLLALLLSLLCMVSLFAACTTVKKTPDNDEVEEDDRDKEHKDSKDESDSSSYAGESSKDYDSSATESYDAVVEGTDLIGTWYARDDGNDCYYSFNANGAFELEEVDKYGNSHTSVGSYNVNNGTLDILINDGTSSDYLINGASYTITGDSLVITFFSRTLRLTKSDAVGGETDSDAELKKDIVGDWNYVEDGIVMNFTFNADGTMLCNMMGMDIAGVYTFAGVYTIVDGKLTITILEGDNTGTMFEDANLAITAAGLTLSIDGEEAVFSKGYYTESSEDVDYTGEIDKALIGTWQATSNGMTANFVFNADGSFMLVECDTNDYVEGVYTARGAKLDVTLEGDEYLSGADYIINGNKLTITYESLAITFTKIA